MWTWRNSMLVLLSALLLALLAGCGGNSSELSNLPAATSMGEQTPQTSSPAIWPADLPQDTAQPWEQLDASGHVIPSNERSASALNANSEFVAGVERYTEGGTAADNGEATSLSSASGTLSWSMYRVPLGGDEPGVITVDANLTAGKGYYVGLANYGTGSWAWHGPLTDNHVRFSTADTSGGADFTSSLGSVFACVVASDGAACDVIGIGVNPVDTADTEAPPAPDAPTATAVDGGLELEWMPVVAGDLAGYRIYSSSQWFFDDQGTGVEVADSLEGLTRHVLSNLDAMTFVRISAVDISGNESPLSDIVSAEPLAEAPQPIQVKASAPSGALGETINITATGADSYDFDTNGDGTYDITGDTSGMAAIDTTALGIIRPTVRGTSGSGTSIALGGVSVIISGNSRPVASAKATPTSGIAPLSVQFDGSESNDFDGNVVGGGWDFDGNGTFDVWSDTELTYVTSVDYTYTTPGVYNAKLRVVDDQGAWDVDTVSVVVLPPAGNMPPVAVLRGSQFTGNDQISVEFSGADSYDPDGSITDYEWDFDGNGVFNEAGAEADSQGMAMPPAQAYTAGLPVVASLRVTDNEGATAIGTFTISVHGWARSQAATGVDVGAYSSLAIVDGNPAMSYIDQSDFFNYKLYYVRATDSMGSSWDTPVALDPSTNVGEGTTLLVVDGNPAVCYRDFDNGTARFIRATDADGTAWGTSVTAASSVSLLTMAIVDGNPAICFGANTKLAYARATDALGNAWGSPVDVDTSGNVFDSSMGVVDGLPAITYYSYNGNELRYVRATDAQGTAWGSPVVVDTNGDTGWNSRMAIVDGNPAVSYYTHATFDLMYARANDAQGSSWGTPVAVDTTGDVGSYSSLAVIDGNPAISYSNWVATKLYYIRASDAQGSTWGSPQSVSPTAIQATYTSLLAMPDGQPAIGYYNNTQYGLSFSKLY